MQRFRFPIAVAFTSLALVAVLIGAGGVAVGNALAIGPFSGAGSGPGHWSPGNGGWQSASIPPELAELATIPAGERFSHFRGVRVQLADKDNNPLTVEVTPGTATTVTPTSLTISANDGSTRTFTLNDRTMVHGQSAQQDGSQRTPATIGQNEKVVVVALNGSTTATGVMVVSPDGFGPRGGPGGR